MLKRLKQLCNITYANRPLVGKALFVFGIALLLRITVSYYTNSVTGSGKYLFYDSGDYYKTAVNLANGHGYVLKQGQEPYFFREPSTIYFYAANVFLYKTVTGKSVVEPSYDNNRWPQDRDNQQVIKLIRLTQAILQALALVFFYLLLLHFFTDVFSFIVAVAVALWPPLAFFSENLLRENLLLGVLSVTAYALSSHVQKPGYWKLVAMGVLWGISALTLQIYMVLGVFLFLFIFLKGKNFLPAAKQCTVIFLFFVVTVTPWLYKVYSFYPDIRIVKSMGCAITFDWGAVTSTLQYAKDQIPPNKCLQDAIIHHQVPPKDSVPKGDEILATPVYSLSTSEYFLRAFNGDFKRTAKQLKIKYGSPSTKTTIRIYTGYLVDFFCLPGYITGHPYDYRNMLIVMYTSFFLGIFSIIGLWTSIRRIPYILPIYLFHLTFFWILMSEHRRVLPIVPFFILFGIIGLLKFIRLGFPQCQFSIYKDPKLNS